MVRKLDTQGQPPVKSRAELPGAMLDSTVGSWLQDRLTNSLDHSVTYEGAGVIDPDSWS